MITSPSDIRQRYKIEQSVTDEFLKAIIADVEEVIEDALPTLYPLWEDSPSDYPEECGQVRMGVTEIVTAKLVNKCYFVFSAFGSVVKVDDYSQQVTDDQRRMLVNTLTATGSNILRNLINSQGGKYNYFLKLAGIVSAHEIL